MCNACIFLLVSSLPSSLLCRDDQLSTVREWVEEKVREEVGGALYISGAPGTGKTACVTHLLQQMKVYWRDFVSDLHSCVVVETPYIGQYAWYCLLMC